MPSLSSNSREPRTNLALVLAAGFALIGTVACWCVPLEGLLRYLSCDDSFYFSEIARRIAEDGSSSLDGRNATNGYQPLWLWLQVPIFLLGLDDVGAIRATRALEVLLALGACCAWIVTLTRAQVLPVAACLMLVFFTRAHALYIGMEAGVSVASLAACGWLLSRLEGASDAHRELWALLTGVGLSLAALARLDNLAFAGAVTVWVALFWRSGGLGRRGLLCMTAPQVVILGAYALANQLAFETALPVSGLVKQMWSESASDEGFVQFVRRLDAMWSHGHVRDGVLFGAVALFLTAWRRRTLVPMAAGLLGLAAAKCLYYSWTVEPRLGTYSWYFVTGAMTRYFALGLVADLLLSALKRRLPPSAVTWTCLALVIAASGRNLYRHVQQARRAAPEWEQASYDGALWLASHVPGDARVASFDAGVLAYFTPHAVTNLDGLVGSMDFLRDRRAGVPLEDFLERDKIDYVANVVADPDGEFARKGLEGEPGSSFELLHRAGDRVFVDGAWRSFVVLKRRE